MKNFLKENWFKIMKISWVKIRSIIPQILAIIFILFIIFYSFKFSKNQEEKNLQQAVAPDQLIANLPYANFHVSYWDFTKDYTDSFTAGESGFNKKNFLIVTDPRGSGSYIYAVKLFENGQMIFSKDFLYQGDAFFDYNNYLDITYGIRGDTNCCPPAFILERYKYNSLNKQMELVEKKEYPTKEIKNKDGTHTTDNLELRGFIEKNKADFVY